MARFGNDARLSAARALVPVIVFLSGFTALLYQVFWTRLLNVVLGIFLHSAVTVVCVFMAGLALGNALAMRARTRRPMLLYGIIELCIGAYALGMLQAQPWLSSLYVELGNAIPVRMLVSAIAVLPPAIAMGLTIPLAVEFMGRAGAPGRVAAVYGVNAVGGALGALCASLVFVRLLGLDKAMHVAAGLSALCALACLVAAGIRTAAPVAATGAACAPKPSAGGGITLGHGSALAIIGFNGMALEFLWFRILVYFTGVHTLAFSVVLSAVILGIGAGALGWRLLSRRGHVASVRTGFWMMAAAGGLLLLLLPVVDRLFEINTFIDDTLHATGLPFDRVINLVSCMLVPALLAFLMALPSGAGVPMLFALIREHGTKNGRCADEQRLTGHVLALNTVGSVCGVLVVTYVLVPLVGLFGSLAVVAVLYVATAALVNLWRDSGAGVQRATGLWYGAAFAALLVLTPKTAHFCRSYAEGSVRSPDNAAFCSEGVHGTVSVFHHQGKVYLKINGILQVPTDAKSVLILRMLGAVPALLHPEPRSVMVNAIGAGITISSLLATAPRAEVYGVDICPGVARALPYFSRYNNSLSANPSWIRVWDDGRSFLNLHRDTLDLIVADATHPASAESWLLFTSDFYDLVRRRLSTRGVVAQWVPLHHLAPSDYISLIRTFRSRFPSMVILGTGGYSLFVAGRDTLDLSVVPQDLRGNGPLSSVFINTRDDLMSTIMLTPGAIDRLLRDHPGPLLTDNRSSVEFYQLTPDFSSETVSRVLETILPYVDPEEMARVSGCAVSLHECQKTLLRAYACFERGSPSEAFKLVKGATTCPATHPLANVLSLDLLGELRGSRNR